jgi:putative ABC transport system substrate-binding protein
MPYLRRREFVALLGVAACARPLTARAQQPSPKVARIGYLVIGALESPATQATLSAFRRGLRELGYVEGQSIIIEYREARDDLDRLPVLAAELVNLKVDLIVAASTPAGRAARKVTAAIPIVVTAMGDPVRDGLVATLARPGGNLTGTTFLGPELVPKRLGLLKEMLPRLSRVAALWHPSAYGELTMNGMLREARDAASALRLQLELVPVQGPGELDRAFGIIAATKAEALFPLPSPMLFNERSRIVALSATHRLPAMFNAREFVELGGLIGYGASIAELFRRTAAYVDKIISGVTPSDLPVEQPTKFELFVNLRTAKALRIEIPPTLLASADEVIE